MSESEKLYIGQTVNFNNRRSSHIYQATHGSIELPALYPAIRKYGIENFKWDIIDNFNSKKEAAEKEILWIKQKNSINNGYNRTIGGDGMTANPLQETRDKLSRARLGKTYLPPSFYKKLGDKLRGIPRSQEVRDKISAGEKGKIVTIEQRMNNAMGQFKTKITKKIVELIIKNIKSGKTLKWIESKYSIPRSCIYELFRKKGYFSYWDYTKNTNFDEVIDIINKNKGISIASSKMIFSPKQDLLIYKLRNNGVPIKQLAKRFNVSVNTISRAYKRACKNE